MLQTPKAGKVLQAIAQSHVAACIEAGQGRQAAHCWR